ncbi:MAG: hypothetical protein QF561_02360 [Phycisphaerales bacterium]|jgi:hypothetical protein|nr:hypothetical protein [Phycisphaerales bacterium]
MDAVVVLEAHDMLGWECSSPQLMVRCIGALQAAGGDHALAAVDLLDEAPGDMMLPKEPQEGTMYE